LRAAANDGGRGSRAAQGKCNATRRERGPDCAGLNRAGEAEPD